MKSIYEYFDYRRFLKDFYEAKRTQDSFFSYRYMGQKIGLHASHLIRIFQRERHLTLKSIPEFLKLCKLMGDEAKYFEALVDYNKSKSDQQAKQAFERLIAIQPVNIRKISKDKYELFQHWYYGAIRVLLSIFPFSGDYQSLAKRMSPAISVHQAKKAIRLLEKLGLIKKDGKGIYNLTDQFITTGDDWRNVAVNTFQKDTIKLAEESIERHPKNDRDISTVTIAVSKKDLPSLKERIAEFRKSLLNMTKETEKYDEVYQLNVQLFPLTEKKGGEK